MIRTSLILLVLAALVFAESPAGEDRPGFEPRVRLLGLIVMFKSWPPQGESVALIHGKLENAGFRQTGSFARFRSWSFRPNGHLGLNSAEACSDLMEDDRIRSVLESCTVDRLIFPLDR